MIPYTNSQYKYITTECIFHSIIFPQKLLPLQKAINITFNFFLILLCSPNKTRLSQVNPVLKHVQQGSTSVTLITVLWHVSI